MGLSGKVVTSSRKEGRLMQKDVEGRQKRGPGPARSAGEFSFGPRRYVSSGPRRLFIAQECLMSPAFEPKLERPHALMRVVSSCE